MLVAFFVALGIAVFVPRLRRRALYVVLVLTVLYVAALMVLIYLGGQVTR